MTNNGLAQKTKTRKRLAAALRLLFFVGGGMVLSVAVKNGHTDLAILAASAVVVAIFADVFG